MSQSVIDYEDERTSRLVFVFPSHYSGKDWILTFGAMRNRCLAVEKPTLQKQEMACGDYIIDKEDAIDQIAKSVNRRKLVGVEMENYWIIRAPSLFPGVQSSVLKSVKSLSKNKSDKYKAHAAFISARFLHHILKEEKCQVD